MQFKEPISHLLEQLRSVIDGLNDKQFTTPVNVLSGSTIGQHTRHILEFYIELDKGYKSGAVDYDQRERNHAIESNKYVAIESLTAIRENLGKPDRELILMVNYGADEAQAIATTYYRELIYNLEHTVHHMALIRIGVNAVSAIEIPEGFGIAASTLKYRQACAQ